MTTLINRVLTQERRACDEMKTHLSNLFADLEEASLLRVMQELRHIACRFSSFAEGVYSNIRDPEAREIAADIVRDEYVGRSHRLLYIDELEALGCRFDDLLGLSAASESTMHAIDEISYTARLRSDTYKISLLRFFGEILPGLEYEQLLKSFYSDRFDRDPDQSTFFRLHVAYDCHEGSHADRYLPPLENSLTDDKVVHDALEAIDQCLVIRQSFYDQFSIYVDDVKL